MAERLGEYLVQHGIVTEEQLASVLERQVMMGGRLGTNLIELGYIGEEELVQFLSQKLNIPSAQSNEFEAIPLETIRMISANLAQKYGAIPLRLEKKSLRVAMVNPLDVDAINQLGFAAGCSIRACVATEARVQYALERYYHVSRGVRYISILTDERKTEPAKKARLVSQRSSNGDGEQAAFDALKEQFIQASDRDEVIKCLLDFLGTVLDRVLFLVVSDGQLVGWSGHIPGIDPANVRNIQIPLDQPSLFREAVQKKEWLTAGEPILKGLDPAAPSYVVLLPLVLDGVVIGLIYADNAVTLAQPQKTDLLPKAMQKAAMALKILILKTKLLKI